MQTHLSQHKASKEVCVIFPVGILPFFCFVFEIFSSH